MSSYTPENKKLAGAWHGKADYGKKEATQEMKRDLLASQERKLILELADSRSLSRRNLCPPKPTSS
jgi:hypothetical protein